MSVKVTGEARVRMEKSFLMVLELYRGSSVMAARVLLSTLESAVLCSPRMTAMLEAVAPAVQWEAHPSIPSAKSHQVYSALLRHTSNSTIHLMLFRRFCARN